MERKTHETPRENDSLTDVRETESDTEVAVRKRERAQQRVPDEQERRREVEV